MQAIKPTKGGIYYESKHLTQAPGGHPGKAGNDW